MPNIIENFKTLGTEIDFPLNITDISWLCYVHIGVDLAAE